MENNEIRSYCAAEDNPQILAAHIVAYRFLGVNKKLAIGCMEELARRKNGGLEFDYETYIKNKLEELTKHINKLRIDLKLAGQILDNSELRNERD